MNCKGTSSRHGHSRAAVCLVDLAAAIGVTDLAPSVGIAEAPTSVVQNSTLVCKTHFSAQNEAQNAGLFCTEVR